MAVNIPKTETTFVHGNTHKESAVTKEEAAEVVAGHDHACEFCPGKKFETSRGLATHQRKWCTQAAAVNDDTAVNVTEGCGVSKTTGVRGPPDKRRHCVEWAGFNDTAEKLHGTDPAGATRASDWEPAAHVEGATDVNGNVATDVFWGRKKNVDEAGDHQDKDKPRCPHNNSATSPTRQRHGRVGLTRQRHLPDEGARRRRAAHPRPQHHSTD